MVVDAALATELSMICAQFGEVLCKTSQIAELTGASFYSQVQQELSQQSIQSLLKEAPSSTTSTNNVKLEIPHEDVQAPSTSAELKRFWRRSLEDWIAEQLQARGDGGVAGPAFTTSIGTPASNHNNDTLGSPHISSMSSASNSLLEARPNPPVLFSPRETRQSSLLPGVETPPFSTYPSPGRGLSASPAPPASMPMSPFMPVAPYLLQPSPYLAPFPYPAYFAPPMMSPAAAHGLMSPIPVSPGSTTPSGLPQFADDSSYPWNAGLLNFDPSSAAMAMIQPPTPTPFSPEDSESPQSSHLSTSSLPRLITTDLSPDTGFTSSPTINISRSPTPVPGSDLARSRDRSSSASEPSNQGGKSSHHRRLSSGSVRYHPFSTISRSESSSSLSVLADYPIRSSVTPSPSSLLSELTLTTSNSPQSSNESVSSRPTNRRRRSASSDNRSRTARTVQYDEKAVFIKNSVDVFAVHTQTRTKCEVTEQDVVELELDSDPTVNAPGSILYQVVNNGRRYTPELLDRDCELGSRYQFISTRAGAVSRWIVSFDFDVDPADGKRKARSTIVPTVPPNHKLTRRTYTYVHFPIGTIVVNPTHPIGSSAWWRVQACEGRHDHCPGDGEWTARWDEEGSERRPSRIVQHYATCALRKAEGDFFTLGKLARAVKRVNSSKAV